MHLSIVIVDFIKAKELKITSDSVSRIIFSYGHTAVSVTLLQGTAGWIKGGNLLRTADVSTLF